MQPVVERQYSVCKGPPPCSPLIKAYIGSGPKATMFGLEFGKCLKRQQMCYQFGPIGLIINATVRMRLNMKTRHRHHH